MADPWVTPVDLAANPESHEARIRALEENVRRLATKGINIESLSELSSELGTVNGDRLILGSRDDGWRLEASGSYGWISGLAGPNNYTIGAVEQVVLRNSGGEGGAGMIPAGGQCVLGSVGDGASGVTVGDDERIGRITFAGGIDSSTLAIGAQICGYPGSEWSSGGQPTGIFIETKTITTLTKKWRLTPAGAGSYLYSLYVGQIASAAEDCIVADGYLWAKGDGATFGVLIGTDTQLYRSAANVLSTPDSFTIRTDGAGATPVFGFVRSDTGASLWDFYSTYSDITKIDNNIWYSNAAAADHINLTSISTQCGNSTGIYAISQLKVFNLHEAGPNNYNTIGVIRGESGGDYGCAYVTRKGLRIFSAIPATLVGVDVAAGNLVIDGTLTVGGFTLTVPATGTTALGTGTADYITRWTGTNAVGDSIIRDDGTTVAIGQAPSAVEKLSVLSSWTSFVAGTLYGISSIVYADPTQNEATPASVVGMLFTASKRTAFDFYNATGIYGSADLEGTGTLSQAYAIRGAIRLRGGAPNAGTITQGSALMAGSPVLTAGNTGTITTLYGLQVANQGAAYVTNAYGIYIYTQTGAVTSNYAIYAAGGQSFHAGNFGIGLATTPATLLHVNGGTTTNNAILEVSRFEVRVTNGAGATGLGLSTAYFAESTGNFRQVGKFDYVWVDATDATRKARGLLYAYDTAARECLRLEASGTAAMVSFLGASAIARVAALTTGLTVITHTAPGTPDYAIQDFVDVSLGAGWAFKNHDEANSVLKVVANLQTRVDEIEDKLGHTAGYGLFTH